MKRALAILLALSAAACSVPQAERQPRPTSEAFREAAHADMIETLRYGHEQYRGGQLRYQR